VNIQQALQHAKNSLSESSLTASLDAQILLSHVLQCNTAHLAAWPEKDLNENQQTLYFQLVERRQQGVPVAHLTGQREFWSLNFDVDDSTLIPRPETETLVEYILKNFSSDKNLARLDAGTGSGAIAIAIASERPEWHIVASDISDQALKLARSNSVRHQTKNITFIQSDWFENITTDNFDIIVSNPPYIAVGDPHLQQGDVRFEPQSALTSGKTGMDDIEYLCSHAKDHLKNNGWLIIEHGYNQEQLIADCFAKNGFIKIDQQKDLSGHIRMTAGKKKL
jgi:release factor glutamine methyltransferase